MNNGVWAINLWLIQSIKKQVHLNQILNLLQRKSQNMYNISFSDAVLDISLRYSFF